MKKILIVYYSGTGNTEQMAYSVLDGIQESGAQADLFTVGEISADAAKEYDSVVLGCPAMGAEVLEEEQMEPFFTELESSLAGKNIGLFGSYGWGDGEWMRNWQDRVLAAGANLVSDGVICNESPDSEALDACKKLGQDISKL